MNNYIKVLPDVEVGSLQIHKGINQGLYSDQGTAEVYLTNAINGTCSKVYLDIANDVLFFDVPQGTFTFDNFLSNTNAYIIQKNGLLMYANNCFGNNGGNNIIDGGAADIIFGDNCFDASTGNNWMSSVVTGNYFFYNSYGNNNIFYCEGGSNLFELSEGNNSVQIFISLNYAFRSSIGSNNIGDGTFGEGAFFGVTSSLNTITNIIDAGEAFGKNYVGNFTIKGNIGATDTADLTGTTTFFDNGSGANLIVLASKATSNSGSPEGDLANAVINGATVNYVLI